MKKSFIICFVISFCISSIYAASDGIGEYSISKEINKLIPIAAKGTKDYKLSCETVSKYVCSYWYGIRTTYYR